MMKQWKIPFLILAALLILAVPVFAETATGSAGGVVTLSDDFSLLYLDGAIYHRVDSSVVSDTFDPKSSYELKLTARQADEIRSASVLVSRRFDPRNPILLRVNFSRVDGTESSSCYVASRWFSAFEDLKENRVDYTIDFGYPEDNRIYLKYRDLIAETDSGFVLDLQKSSATVYPVYSDFSADSQTVLRMQKGLIVKISDGSYCYYDYDENGIYGSYRNEEGFWKQNSATLHKIKEPSLIAAFEKAESRGMYVNEDPLMGEFFAIVFLWFFFVVIPLLILVGCIVLFRKSRGLYRKIGLCGICASAAELFTFGLLQLFIYLI